ncbi:unnamed protein product [Rotaria magnacalcarata]|uniref:Uncharacterized protein n=1 Tax=Rotaria magnacalcarata TaxID=392030 RepID=A0A816GBX1_9BILA|nr:unnamed protein product [Rotaria magnacalcarata]CAF1673029.1 unnamed protein product [Rotaria magnacalcarata]CAF3747412.1 unnamed protein product [Rotaria magnacalcarata]CAF3785647.1 unnamed protein product [Rotaria magnacalcarata]
MSTILNSSEDNNLNQNQNAFATVKSTNLIINENHQQIDSSLTKIFLTEHRDLSSPSSCHLGGTSSLSQAVHAALANVIQDPLSTVTGGESHGGGDSIINNTNQCENCSKLRQQLTLLIYEVLNLENTMESKICEYVQRRLSEIAITEQLTSSKINSIITTDNTKSTTINNENIDLSSNSSTCNYTMAQNNNHIVIDSNNSNGRANKNLDCNQSTMNNTLKYRAERTLTFENVLIGDSTLKYLDPARFDIERKTYIKTMRGKRVAQALEFIQTTRFIGTKKIMFHVGANDLNRDKLSEQEVSEQIKELIVTTKTFSPQSEVYISLIFPRQSNDESRIKTEKLNYLLQAMASPELKVFVIAHANISHDIRGCFEDSTHLSKAKGTILFEENIKKAMSLKVSSNNNQRLSSMCFNTNKYPTAPRLPIGLKLSNTNTNSNGYNMNNNALINPNNLVNMNMLNANALSAYLSFLVGGFRS